MVLENFMPGLALQNASIQERYQQIIDAVEIPSLIKLVREKSLRGTTFSLREEQMKHPEEPWRYEEDLWVPSALVRADSKPLICLHVYQPVFRRMPCAKNETYAQLRDRIGSETEELAQYITTENQDATKDKKKSVNAFHLSSARLEYVMDDSAIGCFNVFGDGTIFHNPQDKFNLRFTFLTSFYQINE